MIDQEIDLHERFAAEHEAPSKKKPLLHRKRSFKTANGKNSYAVSLYDLPENQRLNAKTLRNKRKNRAKKKRGKR